MATVTTSHPTVAYVTRHGAEVYANVYRNGTRLAWCVMDDALTMDRESMLASAREWLRVEGFTGAEFVNAPFGSYEEFDYKITVWPAGE